MSNIKISIFSRRVNIFYNVKNRQASLDTIKCIAAFLVVIIHCRFPDLFGVCCVAVSRVAVPLFFIISGFYYPVLVKKKRLRNHCRKLIMMTLAATAFYFLFNVVTGLWNDELEKRLSDFFSLRNVFIWIFFNGAFYSTPFGGHLWYFYAIIYTLAFMIITDHFKFRKWLYYLIPLLLIGNYIFNFLPNGLAFMRRNFIFTGLPYVLIGCLFREKEEKFFKSLSIKKLIAWLLILCALLAIEMLVYFKLGIMTFTREHYLVTPFMALIIFAIALRNPSLGKKSTYIPHIGQVYSSYIYIYHPFIQSLLYTLLPFADNTLYKWFLPLILFMATLFFSIVIKKMSMLIKVRSPRHL